MRITQQSPKTGDPFYDLIGQKVTFNSDIISSAGTLIFLKGDTAVIEDVLYTPGHSYRPLPDIWIKHTLNVIKIQGRSGHWKPDTFVEFQDPALLKRD